MLRIDVSYPYPVLRPEAVDFDKTVFTDQIRIENTATGYRLTLEEETNDAWIELIYVCCN